MGSLKKLFELESESHVKLSGLNEISIIPKPVEGQSICLRVFSEKTYSALLAHLSLNIDKVKDTAAFLKIVIKCWNILNGKAYGADVKHNDSDNKRLNFLLEFGDMALKWQDPLVNV